MPATGALMGTPASISDRQPPHTDAIEEEPFDSMMSETMRMVYGNLSSGGSTWRSARSASAPWPISRRPGLRRNFTSPTREGREVVVQHELLEVHAGELLDALLVLGGAERGGHQRLGLAAGEERRAVDARQQPDLAGDLADVALAAAADAALLVGDHAGACTSYLTSS